MNINKVRRVLKAQSGLQTPLLQGYPQQQLTYWDPAANGGRGGIAFNDPNKQWMQKISQLTTPKPGVTQQLQQSSPQQEKSGYSSGQILGSMANGFQMVGAMSGNQALMNVGQLGSTALSISDQIKNLKGLKGVNKTAGIGGIAGTAADTARNVFFGGVHDNDSGLTTGLNTAYDAISTSLMGFTPVGTIIGGAMKVGGFVGDALSSMGVRTDQMTTTDQILDSNFIKLTPVGLVNAIGAKKTQEFSIDRDTIEDVGGSYGGSVKKIENASDKAGKKYGLFSGGARRKANREIDTARTQQNTMAGIAKEATDRASIAANMSDLNHLQYSFNLNGGYDQRYMRAAKFGTKIQRIKKLNLPTYKTGGQINGSVNLETQEIEWQPTIIEEVEQFEEGGTLWSPVILQSGGKAVDGITGAAPKITFESWYNLIPKDRNDTTQYNLRRAFELAPMEELEAWRTSSIKDLKDGKNHLNSVYLNPETGEYEFMKSKNHPTLKYELEWYNSDDPEAIQFRKQYDLDTSKDYYKYVPKKFKSGGKTETEKTEVEETTQKNIIPEGALHAHKHHMENSEGLTQKGIPVVDEDGEQQAEIEKNEIIFTLEVTKKLEELYSKYTDHEHSQKEKDEVAIEAGKLLVEQVLFNTEDRTGLISTLEKGGVIDGPK